MSDNPHPVGSAGMEEAVLALTYDPKAMTVSDITLGSIPAEGVGWHLVSVVDQATGQSPDSCRPHRTRVRGMATQNWANKVATGKHLLRCDPQTAAGGETHQKPPRRKGHIRRMPSK
jgi:hypothetical protein